MACLQAYMGTIENDSQLSKFYLDMINTLHRFKFAQDVRRELGGIYKDVEGLSQQVQQFIEGYVSKKDSSKNASF